MEGMLGRTDPFHDNKHFIPLDFKQALNLIVLMLRLRKKRIKNVSRDMKKYPTRDWQSTFDIK